MYIEIRPILRRCKCWRCKHKGEYEWKTGVKNSKKIYCNKTKRWGSPKRASWCEHFESNSSSFVDA